MHSGGGFACLTHVRSGIRLGEVLETAVSGTKFLTPPAGG